MPEKILISDLPCYKEAEPQKGSRAYELRNACFDLGLLPTEGLREEFLSFIQNRIGNMKLQSVYVDSRHYSLVGKFLTERYPAMNSLLDVSEQELVDGFSDWLVQNGRSAVTNRGKESAHVPYIRKAYCYLLPEGRKPIRKSDAWKIRICDLPAYQKDSADDRTDGYKYGNCCYHLDILPTEGLRKEFQAFIEYRSTQITIASLRSEIWQYGVVASFLYEKYPQLQSLLEVEQEIMQRELKKWLMKNGYSQTTRAYKKVFQKDTFKQSDIISYLVKVYDFLRPADERPEREKDIWRIDQLGIDVVINPIRNMQTLNFTKIPQEMIRQEVKDAIFMELQTGTVGTVGAEMVSIKRFCNYLAENFEKVQSLTDLNRDVIENYLIYLNTEADSRKSYRSDLFHLKTIIDLVGRMKGKTELCSLFMQSDIPKQPEKLYRAYSDEEIMRFNGAIVEADVQVARALIVHQMLGTRISDTLTLKQDCIYEKDGMLLIRIHQIKTRRPYSKPINEDVQAVINAAITYTRERLPDSQYVFANEKDASRPMTYAKIQYQLMAIIADKDLRDDTGVRFGVGTHLFRHTYGKKLTEMHYDDGKIAKLLGHANNSSVRFYRKMTGAKVAEESREVLEGMDGILKNLIREW